MKLLMLTANFPFPPQEYFLEAEMPHWARSRFDQVTVMPVRAAGEPRALPASVQLDTSLTTNTGRLRPVLAALASRRLYSELLYLWRANKLRPDTARLALWSTAFTLRMADALTSWLREHGPVETIYSYWNDVAIYAACIVKARGLARRVVSRAHGFDIYEERWARHYMPLKRQFAPAIDTVFVLSEQARAYMSERYGFEAHQLEIGRLGVQLPAAGAATSPAGELHLLSVSALRPVKRVDRIIDALAEFAIRNPDLQIRWTHTGDGPLRDVLHERSRARLGPRANVRYEWRGQLSNAEVQRCYLEQPVDLFMNTSESEGVPVSIMEAMAAGVPAIAPDVGGIADLVDPSCGYLLPARPDTADLLAALDVMRETARLPAVRAAARDVIATRFLAERNYADFVARLEADALAP